MADSAKGKKSKTRYSVQSHSKSYGVFCTKSSRFLDMEEIYILLKRKKSIKLINQKGKDLTEHFKQRAEAHMVRVREAAKKQQLLDVKREKLREKSGLYCDCLLSSRFSSIAKWRSSNTDIKPSDIGKPTPAILNSEGYCAFCGYQPFYVDFAPTQGRPARAQSDKLLKGHRSYK